MQSINQINLIKTSICRIMIWFVQLVFRFYFIQIDIYLLNQVFIDFFINQFIIFSVALNKFHWIIFWEEGSIKNNISTIFTHHEIMLFSCRVSKPRSRGGIQAGGAPRERKSIDTVTQIPGSTQYMTQLHSNISTQSMVRGVGRKRGRPPKVCYKPF